MEVARDFYNNGSSFGFPRELEIEQIFSTNEPDYKGELEHKKPMMIRPEFGLSKLEMMQIWAKVVGKLLAHPEN